MQKIFYNARFLTMNDKFETSDAMLVNDESIVFVGEKQEVLQMKTDETELVDLKEKVVIPTFFDMNIGVYQRIETVLKNAKKDRFIEKEAENDENYEKFENFKLYEKEFLKIQTGLLKLGVTTIQESICSKQEFCFWKKIAESGNLKIDVIGYVDFLRNKQIMDDNCRSFRKYKNHFRLGGYYIKLDGSILEKKAWLKKPYPKEHGYLGYGELGFEQLKFIIKTAFEEKKQLVVYADGDRAVEEFLKCFEEQLEESKVEDTYRPIIVGCNFVSRKLIQKMIKLKITPNFEIDNLTDNADILKSYFGRKLKKMIPFSLVEKENMKMLLSCNRDKDFNSFEVASEMLKEKSTLKKVSKHKQAFLKESVFESLTTLPAYNCFDLEQKGSLESGKRANFLVIDKDISAIFENENKIKVLSVYLDGELVFSRK